LLASNSGGNCSGPVLDGGHDLSFAGAGCPATFAGGDPNLGPLQDNGGPSQTVSLGTGSAAIDQIPGSGAGCEPTDQRGVARPTGASCDIGAYEVAGPKASTGSASSVSASGAVLGGSVTPNAGDATVQFLYRPTSKYGSASRVEHLRGVSAIPVTARIGHLKTNTGYHFRLVVTTIDGTARGADRTFSTSPVPKLTRFAFKPRTFKAGSGGGSISYTDSQTARTTFVVLRRLSRHRTKRVARFSHADRAGTNKLRFRARGLGPGSYILQASARARGRTSRTLSVTFTIRRA
jgi:hypothetical protein